MSDTVRVTLRQIVEDYGVSVCEDPRRVEALLRDLCDQHRREIFLLVGALREGVAVALLASGGRVPAVVLASRLTQRLQDNLGLTEDAARWVVESWAFALGLPSSVSEPATMAHASSAGAGRRTPVPAPPNNTKNKNSQSIGRALVVVLALIAGLSILRPVGRTTPREPAVIEGQGAIIPDGRPVNVVISTPGEDARLTFEGQKGQKIAFSLTDVNCCNNWTLEDPGGVAFETEAINVYPFWNMGVLDADGVYTLVIHPREEVTGSLTLTMWNVPPDDVRAINPDGPQERVTIGTPSRTPASRSKARRARGSRSL